MPDVIITVTAEQVKIAQYVGNKTGKTPKQILEGLIAGWCNGQIDGYFIKKLSDMTLAEKISLLGDIT